MKRSLLSIFFLLIVTLAAVAQPRISSNKETHNFGQIEWKRPVTVEYTITNTGNQPLVLTNVTTSCACAVADWTKEPIAPGAKGIVKASFDAKALGRFEKSVGKVGNAEHHSWLLSAIYIGEGKFIPVDTDITDSERMSLRIILYFLHHFTRKLQINQIRSSIAINTDRLLETSQCFGIK